MVLLKDNLTDDPASQSRATRAHANAFSRQAKALGFDAVRPLSARANLVKAGALMTPSTLSEALSRLRGDPNVQAVEPIVFDHPDLLRNTNGGRLLAGYDFVSDDGDGSFVRSNDGDG